MSLFTLGCYELPAVSALPRNLLADSLAFFRASLAAFLARLKALRACLNLPLASRAFLRAISACCSAATARPMRRCACCLFLLLVDLGAFIHCCQLVHRTRQAVSP